MSDLIAIAQIEALYYPVGYKEPEDDSLKRCNEVEHWDYEYIPKDREDQIVWNLSSVIDELYPYDFMEITDGDWEDEGEFIFNEVLKRVKTHPELEITEGTIYVRHSETYKTPEEYGNALYVRFPVILRAYFDYDSYSNESDCWYEIRGVPDLNHLEDLLETTNETDRRNTNFMKFLI